MRTKPLPSNDTLIAQMQQALDRADGDPQGVLIKEILANVLKLHDPKFDLLDLKIINRALKELRHAFAVFSRYRERPKISIFGSARTLPGDPQYQMASRFAARMVQEGYMVITGGADGIMRAGQEGAGREHSFGVNIMLPFEQGANATIADDPKLITFKYFFTRKLMFQKEATAIALFPGGFGTHDEGFEVLTLAQTGKSDPKPIVCLQTPDSQYWDHWRAFIKEDLLGRGLINQEDLSLFRIVDSEEAAVQEIITFYRRYHSMRFVGRQLVMRLKSGLSDAQLASVQERFRDLLQDGTFAQREAFAEESDEPELQTLPRLVFAFNRRSAGRLRQLIDHLNHMN
ncbi:MAG: LOG family protein [Nitrospiraceae bacterium]